ncbi:hypothetical protein [Roseimicrobium sp. ORNL1]|uniref:hypothetical protein n=1 Tax=Roseimicrobium sp. ORNL1 TaxID=2711231 RepID=UPI0013E186AD|nr:hypothetical protein [Roseimicrobium sp. ORNL1]QIF01911.1 hypothetical protein G5S37_10350 [Roseimicrobium sp. ORNL1]
MNDIRKVLDSILKESGVDESELVSVSMTKVKTEDKWVCAVQTLDMIDSDPSFIRVDVDKDGAKAIPML